MANKKMGLFDKLNLVFTKDAISKEEFGRDGYMILRFLSMHEKYALAMNRVQRYQGVLGYRVMVLLQHMFSEAEKAPFLEYVKKEGSNYNALSPESLEVLKKLFNISKRRLLEYQPNIWATDDEIKTIWGLE